MDLPFGLTDVIAQGLRGRRVRLTVAGRTLTGLVSGIEVRPGRPLGAGLQLSRVRFDGMPASDVSLRASEIALALPPRVGFLLSGIELTGTVAIDELVAWANRNSPVWRLERIGADGVLAVEREGPRRVVAVPSLVAGALTLQIQRIAWGELGIDVPSWLPLTHSVELPALPAGVSVIEAVRRGESLAVRLAVRDVGWNVDLRDAFTGGGP